MSTHYEPGIDLNMGDTVMSKSVVCCQESSLSHEEVYIRNSIKMEKIACCVSNQKKKKSDDLNG